MTDTEGDAPIPLARPQIDEREHQLVADVLRSERLSLGPRLQEFEQAFASRLGVPFASAVSSGTAGLHLAVRAAGIQAGQDVVTSPFSFVASANCILYEGARPVFCDIDRRTLNLDPDATAEAIGPRTAGLLPVHIFGYPAAMPAFEQLCARHGLWLVEDACEALGATHADGPQVGGRGNLAAFGFYANKQMTTGEGGMVTASNSGAKQQVDSERNQGRAAGSDWLDHCELGYNYRLSELACALGLAQLEKLDAMLAARRRVASLYTRALSDIEGLELPCADRGGDARGWFVYVVQLPPQTDRDATIARLAERGIASKPYLPAIHLMSYYRERFGFREGEFPVCEDVARRSLALPFYPQLTETEVARVAEAVKAATTLERV